MVWRLILLLFIWIITVLFLLFFFDHVLLRLSVCRTTASTYVMLLQRLIVAGKVMIHKVVRFLRGAWVVKALVHFHVKTLTGSLRVLLRYILSGKELLLGYVIRLKMLIATGSLGELIIPTVHTCIHPTYGPLFLSLNQWSSVSRWLLVNEELALCAGCPNQYLLLTSIDNVILPMDDLFYRFERRRHGLLFDDWVVGVLLIVLIGSRYQLENVVALVRGSAHKLSLN